MSDVAAETSNAAAAPGSAPRADRWSGAWSVSLLVAGLTAIAACVLVPAADANRRLVYEREKLQRDLLQIQAQVELNREFLAKIETDPQLEQRLALRQMRVVRQGERVLEIKTDDGSGEGTPAVEGDLGGDAASMSPFSIVHVPAPEPLPEYEPWGGGVMRAFLEPRTQLDLLGAALFLVGAGLVLGEPGRGNAE
jgi:hypothetical protein